MQVYRARNPRHSPLWPCADRHFDEFQEMYPEQYEPRLGALRPIIPEVVHKFLDCGNLERGFARIRCDHCEHEYLLAFSCKSRWFCPSRHQKNVQTTARFILDHVLAQSRAGTEGLCPGLPGDGPRVARPVKARPILVRLAGQAADSCPTAASKRRQERAKTPRKRQNSALDRQPALREHRAMMRGTQKQFSLTRAAPSKRGRPKSNFLSVTGMAATTISILLTPELRTSIERRVRSGRYGDASDVVRAGLRALHREEMAEVWQEWQEAKAKLPKQSITPEIEQRVESRVRALRRDRRRKATD